MKMVGFKGGNLIWEWLLLLVTIFLSLLIILAGVIFLYDLHYKNKVFDGVRIGELSLAGKTQEQTKVLVQAKTDKLADQGIEFYFKDKSYLLEPIISAGESSGLAYELWQFEPASIADELYHLGRSGSWWQNTKARINLFIFGSSGSIGYQFKEEETRSELQKKFRPFESPGKDASLVWKNGEFKISEEESGWVFDYQSALDKLKMDLAAIADNKIELNLRVDQPAVTKTEAEFLRGPAKEIIRLAPVTLVFERPDYYQGRKKFMQTEWPINQEQLKNWLKIKKDSAGIYLGINQEVAGEFLKKIAEAIDTPAQDARFEIKDGRVSEWQSSTDGFVLNIEESGNQIEKLLIAEKAQKINLVLSVDKSKITNNNVNDLGIQQLIGLGESNFSGSPKNRRHNISVGAESLNGLLVKPGEEFSLLAALGEINGETGYKPELVIKGDETIAEYGGGLCQISTTMFRLAINAGLPITQRRNHSYRVGYYEPAGTDATIYSPWPDLKFVNDTGNYLLLQTRIEGDNLIFEFWGTSDARTVETTKPVIYNITAPGEPKYMETGKLPVGEKKKIETAHSGADTYFKRTVSWPETSGKETLEETWQAHYIPWREVWLVGKEANATSTEQ